MHRLRRRCVSSRVVATGALGGRSEQQIKWFAFSASVVGLLFLIGPVISLIYGSEPPSSTRLLDGVTALSYTVSPDRRGIAVLQYRLYDIDLIINRTLVYGSLTAHAGRTLLRRHRGVAETLRLAHRAQSTLAVVASTLLIAALFTPLRRRIQSFIDRRFYRKKYDARKTLEAFSHKLRDETDLEALNNDLVGVVRETMQPAHVSLWLRPDTVS